MDSNVKVLCPFCYSSDLTIYPEHTAGQEINKISAESIGNSNTELKCGVCKHIFKAGEAGFSPEAGSPSAPAYHTEAIGYLNPDERFIFDMCVSKDKFTAVKYCVTTYGWGLKEAKDYVDDIMERVQQNRKRIPIAEAGLDEDEIVKIIEDQGKLHAIKFVKDRTGQGLKESKEYVDSLFEVRNIQTKKKEATACYGDYDAPEVLILRRYRDHVLSHSLTGRLFIKLYYRLSPAMATALARSLKGRAIVRKYVLTPLVQKVSRHCD